MSENGIRLDANDRAHVEAVVRGSGTSFFWAMRMLPEEKRQAMFAIYAFCREVDDIADGPGEAARKRTRLAQWREEVERLYRQRPSTAVSRALLGPVRRFALRKADFLAIIDGMEMDAADRVRIADREELSLYCDRVACTVGRLSTRVFGVDDETGERLAFCLGQALQLTNILRDLDEDAQRDRLYLPTDLLRLSGVADTENAKAVLHHPGSTDVCQQLAGIARRHFEKAAVLVAGCDRRQIRPAVMMMEVYRRTLSRLMSRGWGRRAEPVSLSRAERLWVALRYGVI